MNKKGISRFTLRLALVAAVLVCAIFACAGAAYADETSPIPEKVNGKYEIYNADQLRAFASVTNGSRYSHPSGAVLEADKGSSCILMADIDFNNGYWSPVIGQQQNSPFTGTFDGNGHKVSNYQTSGRWYLFGYVSGTIKNLNVDAGTKEMTSWNYNPDATILVRTIQDSGVVINTSVTGEISMPNVSNGSLLAGETYGMIRNCSTHGKLTCNGGCSPLVDRVWNTGVVENCYNTATIISTGGSVPYGLVYSINSNTSIVRNCYNKGALWRNGEGGTPMYNLAESESRTTNCYRSNADPRVTAADLGDAFTDDPEGDASINDGFPVFPYQLTGVYPHVEGAEDIEVEKISYLDDSMLSFVNNTKFEYYTPGAGDFAIRAITEDGRTADIPVTSLSQGGKGRISLTFASINYASDIDGKPLRSNADQEVTVKLLVGGQEKGEGKIEIKASKYWTDYIEEPSVIAKNDERYGEKFSGYYKITSPEELAWIAAQTVNGTFTANCFLANDIYLNDTSDENWKNNEDKMYWDTPIGPSCPGGGYDGALAGTFDGNGHKIIGMYFDYKVSKSVSPKTQGAGLFGTVNYVQNLTVEDAVVKGGDLTYSSGIVCYDMYSITNCMFDGTVTGGTYTGGIVGSTRNGYQRNITACVNKGTISGNNASYTGGICGQHLRGTVESCYNTGEINGSGIVGTGGRNDSAGEYIENCYNAGKANNAIAVAVKSYFTNVYTLIGSGQATGNVDALTEEEFKNGTLLEYLDSENYVADEDNINKGYPILSWQSPLKAAKESYPDELQYYVDLDEYKVNKAKIQAIIDEAKDKIANAVTSAEAKAALEEAKAAIDAIPSDKQVKQQMEDALEEIRQQIEMAGKTLAFDNCQIKLDKASFVHNGKAFEPTVKATNKDGIALVKDTDFEVVYEANTEPGVGKVKVTGKGENYAGTRELTFKILPKKNKITSLKKAKKAFTVKWTKDAKATGYQVSYGLKKNFKGAKTVKITKNTTVSKKVSKLKAKKKYFVKVRTYVTSGGQTVYGAWSPVKSVKTM